MIIGPAIKAVAPVVKAAVRIFKSDKVQKMVAPDAKLTKAGAAAGAALGTYSVATDVIHDIENAGQNYQKIQHADAAQIKKAKLETTYHSDTNPRNFAFWDGFKNGVVGIEERAPKQTDAYYSVEQQGRELGRNFSQTFQYAAELGLTSIAGGGTGAAIGAVNGLAVSAKGGAKLVKLEKEAAKAKEEYSSSKEILDQLLDKLDDSLALPKGSTPLVDLRRSETTKIYKDVFNLKHKNPMGTFKVPSEEKLMSAINITSSLQNNKKFKGSFEIVETALNTNKAKFDKESAEHKLQLFLDDFGIKGAGSNK